jgi:hypothetical protein
MFIEKEERITRGWIEGQNQLKLHELYVTNLYVCTVRDYHIS